MFVQLGLGSVMMLISIGIAGVGFWSMELALLRFDPWLRRRPHRPKLIVMLAVAAIWILAQLTAGVWLWAFCFWALALFDTLETAVYFALVTYTTLGFGDVLLPLDWRLLAGMAAANGLLNMGLVTALLVEGLRQVRHTQLDALKEEI
jgi:hypothetical protein